MDPSPGGSGRYRPALARVGGGRRALGRRRAGEAGREGGGRAAGQRLAEVASSDSSTSAGFFKILCIFLFIMYLFNLLCNR